MQHHTNGGKCGICGDNYLDARPRANEDGGTYGLGIITNTYSQGQVIPITVKLTASHLGHFEFGLCNLDKGPETEECFETVYLSDGSDKYEVVGDPRDHNLELKLPDGWTCRQCSLRWHYRTGNRLKK